jgi:transcriptional regulator with XRE-family HTH domain
VDYKSFISKRITQLRQAKGVSARDMSLSMGQNVNYINLIENRRSDPSLDGLIYICEYFSVTLHEFFDEGNRQPARLNDLMEDVKRLNEKELLTLAEFIKAITENKR